MENKTHHQFSVVRFLRESPKGIDYYVCVPQNWVKASCEGNKVTVAYPINGDAVETRERAKKKEIPGSDWALRKAEVKYHSDSYEDAGLWISRNKPHGRLVDTKSNTHGSVVQSDHEDHASPSGNQLQDRSDKTKQFPKPSTTQSQNEEKQTTYVKRVPWPHETPKSTAQNVQLQPVPSTKTSTITRVEQSMESAQAEVAASASGEKYTEECSHSSKQVDDGPKSVFLNLSEISITSSPINNTKAQQEQPASADMNNVTAAPKPPSLIESPPNRIQVKNIQTLIGTTKNQETRVNNTSNTRPPSSQLTPNSLSGNQIKNIIMNSMIVAQSSSSRKDLTKPSPKPTQTPTATTPKQNTAKNPLRQEPSTSTLIVDSTNCAPVAGTSTSSLGMQHITGPVPATDSRPHSVANGTALPNLPQFHLNVQEHAVMSGQYLIQVPPKQTRDSKLEAEHQQVSHIPQSQPIPSFDNNPTKAPSQSHQPLENQHQGQRTVNHRDALGPQTPVNSLFCLPYFNSLPKNKRGRVGQGVKKRAPPATSPKMHSISRVLLTAFQKHPRNDQELQALLKMKPKRQSNPGFRRRSKMSTGSSDLTLGIDLSKLNQNVGQDPQPQVDQTNESNRVNVQAVRSPKQSSSYQPDVCMQGPRSRHQSTSSDSGIKTQEFTDNEAPSRYEMTVDEAQAAVNGTDQIQNSIDKTQLVSPQMIAQFSMVCSQVSSTLRDAASMIDTFRNSLHEAAKPCQTCCDNVRINTSENSASHAPSSNVALEIPPVVQGQNSAPAKRTQHGSLSNSILTQKKAKKNSEKQSLSTQLDLPPEYDPNDTKWTLRYRNHMPGLVKLMPDINIYVSFNELKRCEQVSNSCEALAQMMLYEVFDEKALGVCALMTENDKDLGARPRLDNDGYLALLNYVNQYGLTSGWNADVEKIIQALHREIGIVRLK